MLADTTRSRFASRFRKPRLPGIVATLAVHVAALVLLLTLRPPPPIPDVPTVSLLSLPQSKSTPARDQPRALPAEEPKPPAPGVITITLPPIDVARPDLRLTPPPPGSCPAFLTGSFRPPPGCPILIIPEGIGAYDDLDQPSDKRLAPSREQVEAAHKSELARLKKLFGPEDRPAQRGWERDRAPEFSTDRTQQLMRLEDENLGH